MYLEGGRARGGQLQMTQLPFSWVAFWVMSVEVGMPMSFICEAAFRLRQAWSLVT